MVLIHQFGLPRELFGIQPSSVMQLSGVLRVRASVKRV